MTCDDQVAAAFGAQALQFSKVDVDVDDQIHAVRKTGVGNGITAICVGAVGDDDLAHRVSGIAHGQLHCGRGGAHFRERQQRLNDITGRGVPGSQPRTNRRGAFLRCASRSRRLVRGQGSVDLLTHPPAAQLVQRSVDVHKGHTQQSCGRGNVVIVGRLTTQLQPLDLLCHRGQRRILRHAGCSHKLHMPEEDLPDLDRGGGRVVGDDEIGAHRLRQLQLSRADIQSEEHFPDALAGDENTRVLRNAEIAGHPQRQRHDLFRSHQKSLGSSLGTVERA